MRPALCLLVLAACLDAPPPPPEDVPEPVAIPMMKATRPPFGTEGPRPHTLERPQEPEIPAELRFGDFDLSPAIHDGRLSLVPIVAREPTRISYTTLQEGMASGKVIAAERGEIESVTITNRSDQPLAILGGELIVEGHQDRLIVRNTTIPPHRTQQVATVCAELSRNAGPERFRAGHALAEPTLRRIARGTDQFAVWERIDQVVGNDHGTSYRVAATFQRRGVNSDRLRHLVGELESGDREAKTVGFAVAIDDKVIAVEHFASPELYRSLRSMVIASYLPSSTGKPRPTEKTVGAAEIKAFQRRTGEGGPVPRQTRAAAPSAARPAAP